MSEYQHYQFLAVDRPLSDEQLAAVRGLTTRAEISRTTFLNTYQWGDFKGSPERLMEDCYDAYLYFANWGTREVMLRWPAKDLPLEVAQRYCTGGAAVARQHGGHTLITLVSDPDEPEDFNDLFDFDDHDTGREDEWLPSIAKVRPDVAAGDLRLLYLAWLLRVQSGELDDDIEPPLPAGLADLPDSLTDLVSFLRIDPDLIAAAADPLPGPVPDPHPDTYRTWVETLPGSDKDSILLRLLNDDTSPAVAELRSRFRASHPAAVRAEPGRTAAQLRAAKSDHTALRIERERREEAARNEADLRAAREAQQRRLADLQHDPEGAWVRVTQMIAHRAGRNYPAAVQILEDLAALAARDGTTEVFARRCRELRLQHPTKKLMLQMLDAADL